MTEFLIVIELADNAQEAVDKATTGKIFEEEGFEMIAIQTLLF